ncbi:MAG: gliding motility-associated ABC transporter ATP-binding subunit GldA [Bacteroidales bacterium]|nr:gliding motility-associated ABC transporter ATP-binding subunit GldA [Bacteroidales bacterium]
MSIRVDHITKLYGKQKALDDVSFSIKTGEIVGFIGPNGAGKSTMMKIITGFIPQTEGDAFVNDLNILEHSLEVRRMVGYLPENNPLYTDMYVREYLAMVAKIYKAQGTRHKAQGLSERVGEMIGLVGLEKEQHKKIGALSKGYRQRVGLAQALIHDPSVLILDEPTSGLDPNQIVEIRNFIAEVGKEKTILLSTHIMQEVEAICDRVIIINGGKIVADDSAHDIQAQARDKHQTIEVEVEKAVIGKDLKSIAGVVKVKKVDARHYLIEGQPNRDIRSEIFQWAVKSKSNILELTKREKSMEEVFQELTK